MSEKIHNDGKVLAICSAALIGLVGFLIFNCVDYVRHEKDDAGLISAIRANDSARAIDLLNHGADPDSTDNGSQRASVGMRIIEDARRFIRLRPLRCERADTGLLVLCKPKRDAKSNFGYPYENIAILMALLEHGAKVNAVDNQGYSPLAYAVAYGNWFTAAMLAEHGANVNAHGYDYQPILASSITHPELVRILLDKGADVEARSESGATPLMIAAEYNQLRSVNLLLAHGARVGNVDYYGKTALDYAHEDYARQCAVQLAKAARVCVRDDSLRF